eukprot:XP_011679711.1 PREDICTED: MAM and LDL-receptor class A domain-containing protein 1 [Strongylocentrotus purpuratus]
MNLLSSAILLALAGLACCQDCNFDANRTSNQRCGWSNDYEDDFDWSVRRLPTPTPFTGPSGDHTTGSGNFLYTEASGRNPGEKARIYSPFDSPANEVGTDMTMISFWYSMWDGFDRGSPLNRTNMGTLNVYITYDGGKVPINPPVWSRSGSQTDRSGWKEAKIMFTAPNQFRIVFEGVIGKGERSDIGIDDVMVRQPKIPNTCNFESSEMGDLCFFYQEDIEDDFDWTRHSGETPSLDTGPLTDHTLMNDTGHYMYIETTRKNDRDTAILKSVELFKERTPCNVDFYYHAFGDNVGELSMAISYSYTSITYVFVNGQSNLTDSWKHFNVFIPPSLGYYNISFIGSRGDGNLGDIAFDDISLSEGCFATDVCGSNPCLNGGSCNPQANSQYYCGCTFGWTGQNCETDIDFCVNKTCSEGHICHEIGNGGYECLCPEGYQGSTCQEKIPTIEPLEPVDPPEPIDIRIEGVDPEMIPVIIGSCIGSFILIATASWFTATCIKNDGFRRKAEAIEGVKNLDVEDGKSNAYINTIYDPDDPDDEGKNEAGPSTSEQKDVEEAEEPPCGSGETTGEKDVKAPDYEDVTDKPSGSEDKVKGEDVKEEVNEDVKEVVKDQNEYEEVKEVESKPELQKEEDIREVEKTLPTDLSTKYDDDSDSPPQDSEENREKGVVLSTSR